SSREASTGPRCESESPMPTRRTVATRSASSCTARALRRESTSRRRSVRWSAPTPGLARSASSGSTTPTEAGGMLAEVTRPTAFATVDRPKSWPRLRGEPRPDRLEAPLDSLQGVGPRIAGRLRKLGLATVRDLLEHRPRDYQRSV